MANDVTFDVKVIEVRFPDRLRPLVVEVTDSEGAAGFAKGDIVRLTGAYAGAYAGVLWRVRRRAGNRYHYGVTDLFLEPA